MPPPPPPVYMTPPPVYVTPPPMPLPPVPPPIIAPPPCCYAPPPQYYAPVAEVARPRPVVPMWTSRIGLGVRGTGQVINDGWNNLGIGGEFLYRVSPHLSTELAAEYQHSTANALDRIDIPVTFGLRVHIGRPTWIVSPYFVFAAGVAYASQDLKFTSDDALYVDGQLGGGLELRLGQHLAITADARLDAKKRANGVADNVLATTSVDGKPVHALGDEVGGQFRLGVAAYF
ncbi:MAG TPA: outer membrane beta-barrel protein, partial [Polyangia bacterium]